MRRLARLNPPAPAGHGTATATPGCASNSTPSRAFRPHAKHTNHGRCQITRWGFRCQQCGQHHTTGPPIRAHLGASANPTAGATASPATVAISVTPYCSIPATPCQIVDSPPPSNTPRTLYGAQPGGPTPNFLKIEKITCGRLVPIYTRPTPRTIRVMTMVVGPSSVALAQHLQAYPWPELCMYLLDRVRVTPSRHGCCRRRVGARLACG